MDIQLELNGESTTLTTSPETDLATALRSAGYTGVKCGCDGGICGASKVLLDGEARMACGLPAEAADGRSVRTIEDFGSQDDLHPLQAAFVDHHAVQCGFCIPGMIVEAADLLAETPDPSEAEVRAALDDNVCRCTGYEKPVAAVLDAADRMQDDPAVAADGGQPEVTTDD